MKVTIEIECDNDSFGKTKAEALVQVAELLEIQAGLLRAGIHDPGFLRDSKGRAVGNFSVYDSKPR